MRATSCMRSAALLALAAVQPACGIPPTPPAPLADAKPDAHPRLPAAALNRECEGCHQQIAQQWRASLHHRSFTSESFQRSFEREPLAFCQSCHAPAADPTSPPPPALAELGVGCISCHTPTTDDVDQLRVGTPAVLAAAPPGAVPTITAPHGVLRSPAFGSNAACARCHEFAFPDAAERGHTALMQSTITEQRTAQDSSSPCASCHMLRVAPNGQRSHAFAASRDLAFLRGAARVTADRVSSERVLIELSPAHLGHAFPTGDLFRRLLVEAEAVGPDYRLLASRQRFLTRHFVRTRKGPSLELLELRRDDRVGLASGTPTQVELDLGPNAVGNPVAWRVVYQRVAYPRGVDEANAVIEGEEELASGSLPAPTSPSTSPKRERRLPP